MLISRNLILILLSSILYGQSYTIVLQDSDSLHVNSASSISDTLSEILINSDRIGDFFVLTNIVSDSTAYYNNIQKKVTIDSLISKNEEIRAAVFEQIYKTLIGTKPFNKSNSQFSLILKSNAFITDSSTIQYGKYNQTHIGAIIEPKYKFNNYLSGLISASNENNKWTLNGRIDIHIENQWRTANIINLHWKRLNDESQRLNLSMEEPHPFGLPIGLSLLYDQVLRDGSYINNTSSAGIFKTVPGIAKIGFGGKRTSLTTTSKGDSLNISEMSSSFIYLKGELDHRNDYWLPSKGFYLFINTNFGKRLLNDASSIVSIITGEYQQYVGFAKESNLLFKIFGIGTFINNGQIHEGELFHYGGVSNLRGYVQDVFKSKWIIIPTLEVDFNLSSNQKISLFTDLAIQEEYNPLPFGFGIGLTQVSSKSVLKLFYGLGREDKLKNGKIHIQFFTLI